MKFPSNINETLIDCSEMADAWDEISDLKENGQVVLI